MNNSLHLFSEGPTICEGDSRQIYKRSLIAEGGLEIPIRVSFQNNSYSNWSYYESKSIKYNINHPSCQNNVMTHHISQKELRGSFRNRRIQESDDECTIALIPGLSWIFSYKETLFVFNKRKTFHCFTNER